MTASALLDRLSELGVELQPAGKDIFYRAPTGRLNEDLRAELREHKDELVEWLNRKTPKAVLLRSRYGCLTRGALRDQLVIQADCTREQAEYAIELAHEIGTIIGPDEKGLLYASAH